MIDSYSKELSKSMVQIMEALMEKVVTDFRSYCLNLCFLLHVPVLLLWHLHPIQLDIHQMSHSHASKTSCWPHRTHCRRGVHVGGGHQKMWVTRLLNWSLTTKGSSSIPLSLECTFCLPLCSQKLLPGYSLKIEMWYSDYLNWVHEWSPLRPVYINLRFWKAGAEM